jgi:hypothetical protein
MLADTAADTGARMAKKFYRDSRRSCFSGRRSQGWGAVSGRWGGARPLLPPTYVALAAAELHDNRVKLLVGSLVAMAVASLVDSGCSPECDSTETPESIVTVTDVSTGQPVCGAAVTTWRVFDDAMVGETTLVGEATDATCTGKYDGFPVGIIHVAKDGYETKTVSVALPAAERMLVTRPLVVIVDESVAGADFERVAECARGIRAEVLRAFANLEASLRSALVGAERARAEGLSAGPPPVEE